MKSLETFIAINRFGLGPRPEEAETVSKNPQRWVEDQISRNPPFPKLLKDFRASKEIIEDREVVRMQRKTNKKRKERRRMSLLSIQNEYIDELLVRAEHMVRTDRPFSERMVMFWSNHFTVSAAAKRNIAPLSPAYEREAIRPHIFGKFEDMLIAVVQHPTMLIYLDNHMSMGPNSIAGLRRRFKTGVETGLNENLAREILEQNHHLRAAGLLVNYCRLNMRPKPQKKEK